MYSAPIDFNKQDEGHSAHNPLTWNVITTYYRNRGIYSHKRYDNQYVLTGPFAGTQSNNKNLVIKKFMNNFDKKILNRIQHQKQ